MGVSSLVNRVVYNGDGSTTAFPFSYYFFTTADLVVYFYNIATGLATLAVLGSDYTISGTTNAQGLYPNGGTVNCTVAPATATATAGIQVVIFRNPAFKQNYALLQNGQISSAALVQQMDYLTLLCQRLEDQINTNCIQFSDGMAPAISPILPASASLQPNATMQINALGTGVTLNAGSDGYTKVTVPYSSLTAAALTQTLTLFALPAAAVLKDIFVKHSVAFTASGLTSLVVGVGIASSHNQFIAGFDVKQTVSDTAWDAVASQYLASWANQTNIVLTATAVGANLSTLSAGSVDIYYNWLAV
jgi:hypothetical protein